MNAIHDNHQTEHCHQYQASFTWPTNRIDPDEARRQATQWLARASVDVNSLNRDCKCSVSVDSSYIYSVPGKFVPVYLVDWSKEDGPVGDVAWVRLFTPTRALLQLQVENPKYILRPPVTFTNLSTLLSRP